MYPDKYEMLCKMSCFTGSSIQYSFFFMDYGCPALHDVFYNFFLKSLRKLIKFIEPR